MNVLLFEPEPREKPRSVLPLAVLFVNVLFGLEVREKPRLLLLTVLFANVLFELEVSKKP